MKTLQRVRLHYLDRLPINLFTLANLVINKKYVSLDCLGFDDSDTISYVLDTYTAADYNTLVSHYLSGSEYGFKGGIMNYDLDRNEFIVSACLDSSGLAVLLTGKLLAGQIPDAAQTAIKIASTVFKFIHFQMTAVVSDKIDYTPEEFETVLTAIEKVPGMKRGYMTNIKQDIDTCPDGAQLPNF